MENFKKVKAPIIGVDGNIFNVLGICQKALKRNGYSKESEEMISRVTTSKSYDEALSIIMEYVDPISYDEDVDKNYSNIGI